MKIFKFKTERTCFLLEYKPLRENTYHERKKIKLFGMSLIWMLLWKSQKILFPQFYPPEPPSRPPPLYPQSIYTALL